MPMLTPHAPRVYFIRIGPNQRLRIRCKQKTLQVAAQCTVRKTPGT